ncbi:unnamed protein product, partial [Oncorhynchus mykiss]
VRVIGSFFMINLCLVVIATQFSETKQRESQLMKEQRIRFLSNASTLASFSEPGSCYDELLKLLVHVIRKGCRQVAHVCRALMRRAGMNIAASPPALERERGSQRRRRKASRQGSVVSRKGSIVRGGLGDVETGSHSNNGGAGRLIPPPPLPSPLPLAPFSLAPIPHVQGYEEELSALCCPRT